MLNPNNSIILSIDNTNSFLDPTLNEFYVPNSGHVAPTTKKLIQEAKKLWVQAINILEQHPAWHSSFASSYKNKAPFDWITIEELDEFGESLLSETASFDLELFKEYVISQWWRLQLRPDHCVANSKWAQLAPPLEESDFSKTIAKWTLSHTHPFGPFEETPLKYELQDRWISNIIVTWVATERCVKKTVLDWLKTHNVYLVTNAIAAVDDEQWAFALEEFSKAWVILMTSEELLTTLELHKKIA